MERFWDAKTEQGKVSVINSSFSISTRRRSKESFPIKCNEDANNYVNFTTSNVRTFSNNNTCCNGDGSVNTLNHRQVYDQTIQPDDTNSLTDANSFTDANYHYPAEDANNRTIINADLKRSSPLPPLSSFSYGRHCHTDSGNNDAKFTDAKLKYQKSSSSSASSIFLFFLPTLIKSNLNHGSSNKEKKDKSSDFHDFIQNQLLVMRLKERIVILLICACAVLCVLFVFQAKVVDDTAWEYPKKFR